MKKKNKFLFLRFFVVPQSVLWRFYKIQGVTVLLPPDIKGLIINFRIYDIFGKTRRSRSSNLQTIKTPNYGQ